MGREVVAQPALLGRAGFAAADVATLGVERDDVPWTEVVAVVDGFRRPGCRSEVGEVALGLFGAVLVVAGHGVGDGQEPAPRAVVARPEPLERAVGVLVVAEGEHGVWAEDRDQVGGSRRLAADGAVPLLRLEAGRILGAGDVAGGRDDHPGWVVDGLRSLEEPAR
jgi:hypothetical protein